MFLILKLFYSIKYKYVIEYSIQVFIYACIFFKYNCRIYKKYLPMDEFLKIQYVSINMITILFSILENNLPISLS